MGTANPRASRAAAVAGMAGVMGLGTWLLFAVGVLAPFLVADLGLSDLQIGALPSIMFATGAALAPSMGRTVDRIGSRRACLLIPGVVGAANLGLGIAPGFAALVVVAIIGGVGVSSTNPATNRLVVEALPASVRGSAMGWKQAGVAGSSFLVGALLPSIATAFGWRVAAATGGVVALGVGVALPWLLPSPMAASARVPGPAPAGRRVVGTAPYAGMLGAVNGTLTAYLVLYAVRTLGHRETLAGLAIAALGLAAIVARVGWASLGTRTGEPVRWLRVIGGLAAVSCLAVALLPEQQGLALLLTAAALGLSAMSWHALLMVAAVEGVPVGLVGQVSGTVTRAFYGGYVVGPVLAGAAADAGVGWRTLWLLTALLAAAAVASVRWSDRDHHPAGTRVDSRDAG